MKTKITLFIGMVVCTITLSGQIIHVPADQPTIQAGIDASVDGDTVLVSDGTYFENISFKGKAIMLASHYLMDNDTSHIWNTIIDGSQPSFPDSTSVVRFTSGEDTTSILLGFTIQSGSGSSVIIYGSEDAQVGGGILCLNGIAKIVSNRIINNSVTHEIYAIGGGIGCYAMGEEWLVVINNTILDNTTYATGDTGWRSAAGGGMFAASNTRFSYNMVHNNECFSTDAADGAGVEFESDPFGGGPYLVHFTNNNVQFNTAQGDGIAFGGGLSIYYTEMIIINNKISNNTLICDAVNTGAGINLLGWESLGDVVVIRDNEFIGNMVVGDGFSAGAAIHLSNPDHLVEIRNNLFLENDGTQSDYSEGAINIWFYSDTYIGKNSEIILDGNIFKHNSTKYGGAVNAYNSFNFSFTNNLFLNNYAEQGGAVWLKQMTQKSDIQGSLWQKRISTRVNNTIISNETQTRGLREETMSFMANNTFINNEAQSIGGAIYNEYTTETVATFNNIFWQNNASSADDIFTSSELPMLMAYSDIDTIGIEGTWNGINNFIEDPDLEEDSLHIMNVSPCYDQGTETITYEGFVFNSPIIDIDGENRPMYGGFDIGADECSYPVGLWPDNLSEGISMMVYPNPCNDHATIKFDLDEPSQCNLEVYNSSGIMVETIANNHFDAGQNQIQWQSNNLPNGIYCLRLSTHSKIYTAKVLHLK